MTHTKPRRHKGMNPTHHTCPDCGYVWKHGEHGGHNCVPRLKEKIEKLKSALRRVDQQMTGGEIYEHGWANAPSLPAKCPADYVREILNEEN